MRYRLIELRNALDMNQDEAALYFGLTGKRSRETIGDWELGKARPGTKHRHNFANYLWNGLLLKADPALFIQIWREVAVREWKFMPLSEDVLPADFPLEYRDQIDQPPPFQAPPNLPYFVGRVEELISLKKIIRTNNSVGIISLQGLGGIGKTALAIQLAYELKNYFKDGVLWAHLGRKTTNIPDILTAFAAAYGHNVSTYVDPGVRGQMVRQFLAEKKALIVLDNAKSSEEIKPLLPPTGSCTVIITTRNRKLTATRGAYQIEVPPFDTNGSDAVALFTKLLKRTPLNHERQDLLEIAKLTGHLPLAIAIAVSHLADKRGPSTSDFLKYLLNEKELLNELEYEDESVRATVNITYRILTPFEQEFFATLGAFSGREFSDESAAAIGGISLTDARRMNRRLFNLSLIQAADNGRYNLHPLISLYAREKIEIKSTMSLDNINQRLVDYFISFAKEHKSESQLLHLEMENIWATLDLAHSLNMIPEFIDGVIAIANFTLSQGSGNRYNTYLDSADQAAKIIEDEPRLAKIQLIRGDIAFEKAEISEAEFYFTTALKLSQKHNLVSLKSQALSNLGACKDRQAQFDEALHYFEQAQNWAQIAGESELFIKAAGNAARLKVGRVNYLEIIRAYQQCLTEAQKINHDQYIYLTFLHLGGITMRAGRFEEASNYLREVREYADRYKYETWQLWALVNEGAVSLAIGNYDEANRYFNESLTLARKTKSQDHECGSLINLGMTAIKQNDLNAAENHIDAAVELAETLQIPEITLEAEIVQAELELRKKQTERARSICFDAKQLAEDIGVTEKKAEALFLLARIQSEMNDESSARMFARESLENFTKLGHYQTSEVSEWLEHY